MTKAKKVFTMYGEHSDVVTYEYRGMRYDVEYAKDWSYCVTSPRVQHEDAQTKIDKMIDRARETREDKYEDTAEYGFNLFWDYVNS